MSFDFFPSRVSTRSKDRFVGTNELSNHRQRPTAKHPTEHTGDQQVVNLFRRLVTEDTGALMDLYIHPLYVLVSKILSSILNSSTPIHPLYHPLSTLSTVGPIYHFI
jgi:hypothetical protein